MRPVPQADPLMGISRADVSFSVGQSIFAHPRECSMGQAERTTHARYIRWGRPNIPTADRCEASRKVPVGATERSLHNPPIDRSEVGQNGMSEVAGFVKQSLRVAESVLPSRDERDGGTPPVRGAPR